MKANYVTGKQAAKAAGRAVADQLAREAVERQTAENARMIDSVLAWVLHEEFGFGYTRILRVLRSFVDNYGHARDRYGWDCVETKFAMELRRDGVDFDRLEEEINAYVDGRDGELVDKTGECSVCT